MRKSLDTRIDKIERRIGSTEDVEVYGRDGCQVEGAKVLRMPTRYEPGEAILPDGTRRTIAPLFSLRDLILHARHRQETEGSRSEKVSTYRAEKDTVFMRLDGRQCLAGLRAGITRKRREGDTDAM